MMELERAGEGVHGDKGGPLDTLGGNRGNG